MLDNLIYLRYRHTPIQAMTELLRKRYSKYSRREKIHRRKEKT